MGMICGIAAQPNGFKFMIRTVHSVDAVRPTEQRPRRSILTISSAVNPPQILWRLDAFATNFSFMLRDSIAAVPEGVVRQSVVSSEFERILYGKGLGTHSKTINALFWFIRRFEILPIGSVERLGYLE